MKNMIPSWYSLCTATKYTGHCAWRYIRHLFYIVLLVIATPPPLAIGFPLSTEDTGTRGHGRSKLELTIEHGDDKAVNTREVSVSTELSVAHGLLDNLDLFLSLPHHDVRVEQPSQDTLQNKGNGDARAGMKWRFYTKNDLSLGIKTGVVLPTGDESKLLGTGKTNLFANAIVSYAATPWELHIDIGYLRNHNVLNQRQDLWHTSAAVVHKFSDNWKAMADIATDISRNPAASENPVYSTLGVAVAMNVQLQLNVGLKYGLTPAASDFTWLAGVNLYF